MALPVEFDPITLAKTIATIDHLSGGRVTIGAGFGWNTDELADHHAPAGKRPVQPHIPLVIGAEAGPKTIAWIAAHATAG